MAPTGEAYHIDWICSNISNVHVANHRDWFTKFTPFKTKHGSTHNRDATSDVAGVGDVELELVKSVSPSGKKTFKTIVLRDVLYAPSNIVNVFAYYTEGFNVDFANNKLVDDSSGAVLGMVDNVRLTKLWLKGQPRGKSSLDPNSMYMINARWSDEERARWETLKQNVSSGFGNGYSDEEKQWLKKHYGNEFKFLMQYGLKIFKEEDRVEGRQIVRSMMADDPADLADEDNGEEDDSEEENCFLADIEADPSSHAADSYFNKTELDWIQKHYRHSGNFLRCYGLKAWDDEDCKDGKAIVQDLMHADSENDEEDEEDSFLADLEADPASHVADYHFSEAELDWIKKHHRHSGNFLRAYGLKPWDDEDCKEGKIIVRNFLRS